MPLIVTVKLPESVIEIVPAKEGVIVADAKLAAAFMTMESEASAALSKRKTGPVPPLTVQVWARESLAKSKTAVPPPKPLPWVMLPMALMTPPEPVKVPLTIFKVPLTTIVLPEVMVSKFEVLSKVTL